MAKTRLKRTLPQAIKALNKLLIKTTKKMKTIQIQASKIQGKNTFQLSVSTNDIIERAFFVEITEDDLKDITEMLNN